MKNILRFLLILCFLSIYCSDLIAQGKFLISLGKIQGIPSIFLYCSGESTISYGLMIGQANKRKLLPASIYIANLKKQIRSQKANPRKLKNLKGQLKKIRATLKPGTSQCKVEIYNEISKSSATPTFESPGIIPTNATPTPTPTLTEEISICGNAILESGEICDDGDTSNQNACLNNCQHSYCGDGHLQPGEVCIVDDPVASSYVELKSKLSAQFCQISSEDESLNVKQAALLGHINLMLSLYLQDLSRAELISTFYRIEAEVHNLLSDCHVSNFTPLTVSQLRSIINSPAASTQENLIVKNLRHLLVGMSCQNYPAVYYYQLDYINSLGELIAVDLNQLLDFIEHCQIFQSGRIYDITLDKAYADGLNFQVTYSTCQSPQSFATLAKLTDTDLTLSMAYPILSVTCLKPEILSKPVYVYTGDREIKELIVRFINFQKEFKNIIQAPKITNLVPQADFLERLPREKPAFVPGMYDGFYSSPLDANGQGLPMQLIGTTNIADQLWRELRQVAPPSQTTTLVNIFKSYSYNPNVKSVWGDHPLIQNLDFSGVAWENNKAGTLISRQHIVVAAHFRRDVEDTVMFHDRSGNPVVRKVVAIKSLERDICIAKLDSPVPDGVTHYKLLYNSIHIANAPAIITDQFMLAGIKQIKSHWMTHQEGTISATHDRGIGFVKPNNEYRDVNRVLTNGDSGHPTFLLLNGEMLLIETHSSPGGGPNYASFWNQEMIRKAISDLG